MPSKISVIVCAYNKAAMLAKALGCLVTQKADENFIYEIIVVDDGSTDETKEVVEEITLSSPVPIKYLFAHGKGVSHARNMGISQSQGEWIALFDQDQLVEPDWLKDLFSVAIKTGGEVVDGPRDLALPKELIFRLGRICRQHLGERTENSDVHKIIGRTCSCTGNVLIKRKVIDALGKFDESILEGWEDWDFFRRVQKAGIDIWYSPSALVHHMIPPERLTEEYFRWFALAIGSAFASRDYREWGLIRTVLACIARIGQTLLVHLPLLLWAFMRCNKWDILGRRCYLWRNLSYTRKTLHLLAPGVFYREESFYELIRRREPGLKNGARVIRK
jgi:glycosyltransferase involved in cell wall biosynthesis